LSHFVDTNIVVYSVLGGPKALRAANVLRDSMISVQVLNEYANVGLRKLGYDAATLDLQIGKIRSQVEKVRVIDEETHDLARAIVFRYQLSFYDSVLLASALLADCHTFYSEDMQHGLVIEDQLTIRNPFIA
jgi:predicted nucleic acid-binding protein